MLNWPGYQKFQNKHSIIGCQGLSQKKNLDQTRAVASVFGLSIEELCYGEKPEISKTGLSEFEDEINAGIFEVVLRRVKK